MDKGIQVVATGYYVPSKVVTNDDMSQIVDTNDEWITTRTGIKERHFVSEETTIDLAYEAAYRALKNINKKDIGVIIVASISSPYIMPSVACVLQERLDLSENVIAFDINAACTGFITALTCARALLSTSSKKYALVIGAEALSTMINYEDRSTCVLFGDGAGAMVIQSSNQLYLDYHGAKGAIEPLYASKEEGYIAMQGREVFRFATTTMIKCITEIVEEAHLNIEDIDYFVAHQANFRIISHVYKKLKIPSEKFYVNVHKYGNTSGASIPLAIGEMNEKGLLKKGMKIMMIGFGGGLTYGANIIEW